MKEGDTRTQIAKRRECEVCGKPATYKYTFLLEGARSNPASAAYGKDDCTWCEDEAMFTCEEHGNPWPSLDGYVNCSKFEYGEGRTHMFLYWEVDR